jgi:hypothetical protein
MLPIEFARQSSDGRLTLVLTEHSSPVRSLWTRLCVKTLNEAREALRVREDVKAKHLERSIGAWVRSNDDDTDPPSISSWARLMGLDGVVWTQLRPRFRDINRAPTEDEAFEYLNTLPDDARKRAEDYVRRAPRQVDTIYRQRFERDLGWTSVGDA